MGRRCLIPSPQTASLVARSFPLPLPPLKSQNNIITLIKFPKHINSLYLHRPSRMFCCKSCLIQHQTDLNKYKEAFSKQMTMAGLKPHHRIAIGVSGGPDSMALCVLSAAWKTNGVANSISGSVDGLLAIIVDHGFRAESKEEALTVSRRLSEMGIRCEIGSCDWSLGRPKQGHLQEEARDMRYQKFQNICLQHQISVLLIAHHADDQAELFILRLSRNSGVLGLAGMAFASEIFSSTIPLYDEGIKNKGILLVRPLLNFSKEDMYKAVISACRKTRSVVDQICSDLINQAVTIMHQQGYAIIDLEILNPSKVIAICLAKFIALVLQFISQRHKPVRGNASRLLLDYIRTFPCKVRPLPCKTSVTAAGCYLCPVPQSKGTKILVCCSVGCPLPSRMELTSMHSDEELKQYIPSELDQIIADGKSYSDHLVPDASNVHFLDSTSESILTEAKRYNIMGESTYREILLLQMNEIKHFKGKNEDSVNRNSDNEVEFITASSKEQFRPGQICYFMNRFLITWKPSKYRAVNDVSEKEDCGYDLGDQSWCHCSESCTIDPDMFAEVRHMNDCDWLYLAKLSKCASLDELKQQRLFTSSGMRTKMEGRKLDYLRFAAERSLILLKSIPAAARRSLPVLVNHQGQLLSIPSIGFKSCPCLMVSCAFKPRVPLGGGYSLFM